LNGETGMRMEKIEREMYNLPEFFSDNGCQKFNLVKSWIFHAILYNTTFGGDNMNIRIISMFFEFFPPATVRTSINDNNTLCMSENIL